MLKEVGKGTNLNFVDGGQKLSDAEKELKDRASKTILKIEKSSAGLYEGKFITKELSNIMCLNNYKVL